MNSFKLFFILSIVLFANYHTMQKKYKEKQYQEVINEAKNASTEYHNPQLHLLWAKSLLKLNQKTKAMSAFERVLILDEKNQEAIDALSKLYQGTLLKIDKEADIEQNSLNILLNLASGYNSNINISPKEQALDTYSNEKKNISPLSTNFLNIDAKIAQTYQFKQNPHYATKNTLTLFKQTNMNHSWYNLFLLQGKTSLEYKKSDFKIILPFIYDKLHYNRTDLLNRYTFAPSINFSLSNDTIVSLNTAYAHRNFTDKSYSNYSANTFLIGTKLHTRIQKGLLQVGGHYENRTPSKKSDTAFVHAHFINSYINLHYPLSNSITLKTGYHFRKGFYRDSYLLSLQQPSKKREDTFHQASFRLIYELQRALDIYLEGIYSKNNTNYVPTRYENTTLSLGLTIHY